MYSKALSWPLTSSTSLPLIFSSPRLYVRVAGGAVRPATDISASIGGSTSLGLPLNTDTLTDEDPALMARISFPIVSVNAG